MSNPRQDAREIYLAAAQACSDYDPAGQEPACRGDLLVVEHLLRAVIEVLTPEQRAEVLQKVRC